MAVKGILLLKMEIVSLGPFVCILFSAIFSSILSLMFNQTYNVLDLVEVFRCVLIGHVGGTDVEFEVRSIVLEVVIVGKFWVQEGRGEGEIEDKKEIKR